MTSQVRRRIAVWTPALEDVNGQNLVTRRVVEKQRRFISNTYAYPPGGGRSILSAIWTALRLCTAVLKGKHDGVYVVCSRSLLGFLRDFLPLAMSRFGHSVIVHVHGSDFPKLFTHRVVGRLARIAYKKCTVVIPSAHLVKQLENVSFRSLQVCENFADICANRTQALLTVTRSKSFVVLWNSNIMASKGIFELIEGLRLLRDEGFAIDLIILGRPISDQESTAQKMAEFIVSLTAEKWINVKGHVDPEEVATYLTICDAVALPSTYESECQPLSVVQAMLTGRIVLVAPTDALRATVGTYPAVFARRDPEVIADVLRPYVADGVTFGESLGQEIQIAERRFSPKGFDERMSQVLAVCPLNRSSPECVT